MLKVHVLCLSSNVEVMQHLKMVTKSFGLKVTSYVNVRECYIYQDSAKLVHNFVLVQKSAKTNFTNLTKHLSKMFENYTCQSLNKIKSKPVAFGHRINSQNQHNGIESHIVCHIFTYNCDQVSTCGSAIFLRGILQCNFLNNHGPVAGVFKYLHQHSSVVSISLI